MTQRLPDSAVWKIRNHDRIAGSSTSNEYYVEPEKYCAYNQTVGHLLAADVDGADFSVATFTDRIQLLTANSGAGLWLVPFRGISVVAEQAPLDLIYLDAKSVVIEVVESFPMFSVSKACPPAASVLVLPRQTIHWTQTRRGDQLLLCPAEEFNRRLLQFSGSRDNAGTRRSKNTEKLPGIYSGSGSRLQSDECSGEIGLHGDAAPVPSSMPWESRLDALNDPKTVKGKTTKNWLQRLWSPEPPEPRQAPRETFPSLSAHFWTGGISVEYEVRDISLTGLYVVTDERWSPGTQIRMTLTDSEESSTKNSITANTRVIRWGNDGVGLTFLMENEKDMHRGNAPVISSIVKKDLIRFLELAKSGKCDRETREAHRMVSQSDSAKATIGHADPVFENLFIGPVNSAVLIDSLKDLPRSVSVASASYLSNSSSQPLPAAVSSTPSTRRPCILLIDDEYLDITFLAGTLEEDYEIIFATDGVAALESAGRNMPDLILLDVMMPGIDGFEVCRRLKADIRTKEIPVIFITGLSEVAAETKGLRMGAVDYISKPFNAAPLRARVDMHVKPRMEQEVKST